jgi:catechol 2,3-dioxygenase-like lactoylglutathione lyase family enzyme
MLTHIRSVPIYVTDYERSIDFYVRVLGMTKRTDATQGPIRWIEIAGQDSTTVFSLIGPGYPIWSADKVGVNTGIVLGTDDASTFNAMAESGVEFVGDQATTAWGVQVKFAGPDGNVFAAIAS